MKSVNATEIKNHFGEYLDSARREPLAIQKNGRNVAVLMDWELFERLNAIEDAWWGQQARAAEAEGHYLGHEESVKVLQQLLEEK